jgi:hypothetical protein
VAKFLWFIVRATALIAVAFSLFHMSRLNTYNMTEETKEPITENVEQTNIETNIETTNTAAEEKHTATEPEVKATKKRTRKPTAGEQIEISVDVPNAELDALKAELEAMKAEKAKLEEERTALNETVSKLQEEVKITPQKLGAALKEMGVAPMATSRDTPHGMTVEAYNTMSDSQRREWQRTHRADYLQLMHTVRLNHC